VVGDEGGAEEVDRLRREAQEDLPEEVVRHGWGQGWWRISGAAVGGELGHWVCRFGNWGKRKDDVDCAGSGSRCRYRLCWIA
jgi:hypothetical protein